MRLRPLFVPLAILLVGPTLTAPARAADPAPTADAQASADSMIARGIELRKTHENEQALALFQRALAIDPSPRARGHVALAQQALGRWLEADAGLRAALAARDDPWIARHRDELEEALRVVGAHLGWVLVESDTPGAELLVDGARVASLPLREPVRVASGHHDVTVRAAGFRDAVSAVDVAPGEHFRERVAMLPATSAPAPAGPSAQPAAEPPTSTTPPDASSTRRVLGFVAEGLGVAGIAVGTIFGVMALGTKSDRDQLCHFPERACSADGVTLDARGRGQALVSTIGFAVGVIGLGAGTYLILTAPSGGRASANGAGLGLGGAW